MFEITGSDISELTDADLRTVVARLAIAELARQGLPVSGVTAGGSQDAPDGGIDVRAEVPELPAPDFVPRRITGYQVKKPNMTAAAIMAEMRPDSHLRPVIGELADASGAYVIVSAQGSVADGPLADRRKAMGDAVADHPNASALHVDFYDRERVAAWANRHPGVAAWVRVRVGRELTGWRSIGDWTDVAVRHGSAFLIDDRACLVDERSLARERLPVAEGLARLRIALTRPRRAIRLIGLSGLGKTRLVQALFETGVGDAPIDPGLAIYTDYSDETSPTAREMARRLVDADQPAILVVDNCNPATHAELAAICAGDAGQVSLLTVEYDVRDDEPERTDVFRLENASPAIVETWLQQNFTQVSQIDRRRIAEFSDGNFRVARALAGTLRRGETLGQLRDRDLFARIFQQRNEHDRELLLAAEDLSLLYSFDGTDTTAQGELAMIGALRGETAARLYAHVADLRGRGVVQARGRWRAILPHAIANRLATYALARIPPDDFDRFFSGLPVRMLKSMSRRLGYLHDDPEAGAAVARWLQSDGPIGDVFALGAAGLEIVRNIAPVAPAAVLARIGSRLAGPDGARMLAPKDRERGQWISLVKTLGYDAAMFDGAVAVLARFLAVEPEGLSHNSAARYFGELFQLTLSGTHAPPAARRAAIRRMAESEDPGIKACALRALDGLLKTSRFTSLSHHDFGARPRDFGWRPATPDEGRAWFDEGVALAVSLDGTLPDVRRVLAENVRGIWSHSQSQDALERACDQLTRNGTWIEGWIAFRRALFYDGEGMPAELVPRLHAIIERLKPNDLLDRARAIVLSRSGGGTDLFEGDRRDPAASWRIGGQQAIDLGRSFASEPDMLAVFLPEMLAQRSPHRAYQFGQGLAEEAVDRAALWSTLTTALRALTADGRNAASLCGFLDGAKADTSFVAGALDGVAEDPELARSLTYLQRCVGIDREGIARLSRALDARTVDADDFRQLAIGVVRDAPGDALAPMLTKLATGPEGHAVALDILQMHFICAKDDGHAYDADLLRCGRGLLAAAEFGDGTALDDHAAGQVVEACLAGEDGEAAAREMCANLRLRLDDYSLSSHRIEHLLKALFATQPLIALDGLLLGDGDVEVRLDRPSPLDDMEPETLGGWADVDPGGRYPLVGQVLSIFERSGLDEATGLSPRFLALLDRAPDPAGFLGDLRHRVFPGGWTGSLADVLERRRGLLAPLADHDDAAVRDWMAELDEWVDERIAEERLRDTEKEESFE
ncbi:hypothetical protein [Sphingomonas sp. Leaf205]|uniref:hypothetical protein n=1 Tax=Sphingomonas sp. Leaf205 TaxID=2876551 RepID=UPI001E569FAB|nr:hypothetical protein [Sphingomonas sp. Leaf205]